MESEWIDIKQRLPDEDVGVLVTDGELVTAAVLFSLSKYKYWRAYGWSGYEFDSDFDNRLEEGDITHWQKLPSVPTKPDQGEKP